MVNAQFLQNLQADDRIHAIQELGQPVVRANQLGRAASGLAVVMAVGGCIFAQALPKSVTTALLLCGIGAPVAQYLRLKDLDRNRAIAAIDATNDAAMAALGERLQATQGLERTAQQAENYRKLALLVARQPAVLQEGLVQEFGLSHLLVSRLQPPPMAIAPAVDIPQMPSTVPADGIRRIGVDGSGIPSFIEEQARQRAKADPWPQAPTRDIAGEFTRLSSADSTSLLIVAKPGSGKSMFLSDLQDAAIANGKQVITIDGKACEDLDKENLIYARCNRPDRIEKAAMLIESLMSEMYARMEKKDKGPGIILMIDEWNALLEVANIFDQQQKADAPKGEKPLSLKEALKRDLTMILLQGRSEGIQVVLTSHSPNVEDLAINTGVQTAFSVMALSRNGNHESIQSILVKPKLLSDDNKNKLQNQFATLQNYAEGIPLVLTTFYPMGFYRLPPMRTESTEELMEDIGVSDVNESSFDRATAAANLYALRDWQKMNPRATLAQIAQQWMKLSNCSAQEAVEQAQLLSELCTGSDEHFEKSIEMYLGRENG